MSDAGAVAGREAPAIASLDVASRRGIRVIGLLLLIYVVNFVDRQLPFILVDAIKAELHLTDAHIGLMASFSFAIVYSFAVLPLARLADRISPRLILTMTLGFWSLMTALSGLAQSSLHLALARFGVAAGEAGTVPAAHSIIARTFRADHRASALAIFSLGVPIGSTLGLGLGGWINDVFDWRAAFFIVGIPGLLIAVLCWCGLPEVARPASTERENVRLLDVLRHLFGLRTFRHMVAGSSLFACGNYAMHVFAPAFLIRVHGLSTTKAGLWIGIAFGAGGLIGTILGGTLADVLGRRDPRWRQRIGALGQLISVPTGLAAFLVPDTRLSIVLLMLTYLLGLIYYAPTFAVAQSLAQESARATAAAVLLFCLTLIGASVGPIAIGMVSDALLPRFGTDSLRYAMCLMAFTTLWSALHLYRASQMLPRDLSDLSY